MLQDKTILVGITGSVAAYKAVDLIRRLRDAGATVRAIMTSSAERFITPLSVALACGEPALTSLFDQPFPISTCRQRRMSLLLLRQLPTFSESLPTALRTTCSARPIWCFAGRWWSLLR